MTNLLPALAFVLLLGTVTIAQDQPQHPIDKALDACIEKNGSTAGMVQCTDRAYASWDKELNQKLRGTDASTAAEAVRSA